MNILQFTRIIFKRAPFIALGTAFLYFFAGALELVSLAAILPVLLNILGSGNDMGAAGTLLAHIGLPELSLKSALIAVLAMMSVRGVFLFYADYTVVKLARDLEVDIRQKLFGSLVHAKWSYLLSVDKGQIPNIILRETTNCAAAVQKLGQFAASSLIASVLILASVLVSWQAFLMFGLAVLPYLYLTRLANKHIKSSAKFRIQEANKIGAQVGESIIHLKYIKASGIEALVEEKFSSAILGYARHMMDIVWQKSFIKNFPEIFGVIILGLLVFLSRRYIGENPTDVIFFLLLLFRGYRQLATVQTMLASLIELIPSYEICYNLIDKAQPHFESHRKGKPVPTRLKSLTLKNVSYAYQPRQGNVIRDMSLTIPAHGMFAFVGGSGAGKTTLGDLILSLISPQKGAVMVNGKTDLYSLNLQTWRKKVGYVPQDVFLITGTIRENILMGAENQSEKNLRRAAKLAHIEDFIEALEHGYDTPVSGLNSALSGGQKQRIALARALAKEPKLLILDEATSALDNLTEQAIQEAIQEISRSIPIIIIAHRLSTIRNADKIYVLKQGRISEYGTYKTLMKKKGDFWALNKMAENA